MDEEVFTFGSFRLTPAQRMLSEDGKPLRLGSRALDLLVALVERAGETITKQELIARAWPDTVVEEGALRVHVAAVRKALGDRRAGKRYIANHPGRSYALVSPVTREHALSAIGEPAGKAEAGNLPASLTRVVGREKAIVTLAAQLGRCRFLTVVGPGGIGNDAGGCGRGRRAPVIRGRSLVSGICVPGRSRFDTERPRRRAGNPTVRRQSLAITGCVVAR